MENLSHLPPVPRPHPVSPEALILDETITDVDKTTNKYILTKYKNWLWPYFIFSIIWILAFAWYLVSSEQVDGDVGTLIILPVFIGLGLIMVIRQRILHQFYEQFARANNFSYQKSGWHEGVVGSIFNIGNGKKMDDIIIGKFNNYEICLFNYHYGKGSGKSRQNFDRTVLEVELGTPVPSMVFLTDYQAFGASLDSSLNDSSKIQLPVELEKQYGLYAERKFEIEALQVFTPDVLAQFLDHFKAFNLDFCGSKMYIYSFKLITNKQDLYKMYELSQYIIEKLAPVLNKLKTEVQTLQELQNKQA